MLKRKCLTICFLGLCLTATLFIGVTSSVPYDHWVDIYPGGDGVIDIMDILVLGVMFGEEGTPINKTELLLDLQDRFPRAGNISVPAAAFVPQRTDKDWRNGGYRLDNFETADLYSYWHAQVQLPHGANVTNVTTYWFDNNASHCIHCTLERYNQTHLEAMAYIVPPIEYMPGWGSYQAPSIIHPTVDNNKYAYFLDVILPSPSSDFYFQFAVIEYEY